MRNPYAHEHSVRLTQPDKSKYLRFRRQNNVFGNGVAAIFGILRKKIGNAKTELQALRFDARKFTPAMVRKWIDSHGGRKLGLVIESATDYAKVGEVYRGNPMSRLDVAAWLEAAYHEEKKGVIEYEKLLRYISGQSAEYSMVRKAIKHIVKDEKRHIQMLGDMLRFS